MEVSVLARTLAYLLPLVAMVTAYIVSLRSKQHSCERMHTWRVVVYPGLSALLVMMLWMSVFGYTRFATGILYALLCGAFGLGLYFIIHVISNHRR